VSVLLENSAGAGNSVGVFFEEFQEIIKRLPLESLLVETDAPFLAPVPFRGKRNEPSYVRYTAQKVAEIKKVSLEKVAEANPKFTPNRHQLARNYFMLGEINRSLEEYQVVLAQEPNNIGACIDLAQIYERNKSDQAYRQWEVCWKIYQSAPEFYQNYADLIYQSLQALEKKR
jgi:tetratricopeptide (TPR) repeat protein